MFLAPFDLESEEEETEAQTPSCTATLWSCAEGPVMSGAHAALHATTYKRAKWAQNGGSATDLSSRLPLSILKASAGSRR